VGVSSATVFDSLASDHLPFAADLTLAR
jgi:hypothetical protein